MHSDNRQASGYVQMVPMAGLEPARLSPLPPQDSVSTKFHHIGIRSVYYHRTRWIYSGISSVGSASHSGSMTAGCSRASGSRRRRSIAGSATCPMMLSSGGVDLTTHASARQLRKNRATTTAVARLRKVALPRAPNREPEAPPPNAAPVSAPRPCCSSTRPMMLSDSSSAVTRRVVYIELFSHGLADGQEFVGLQRCAADQAAVDIRHGEQLRGIACLDAAAVEHDRVLRGSTELLL